MESKKKDKRIVLLVLPLVLVPLLALCFYALGGGRSIAGKDAVQSGINVALPDAKPESSVPVDKLGIYELAGKDTALKASSELGGLGFSEVHQRDAAVEIESKLKALDREINRPDQQGVGLKPPLGSGARSSPSDITRDVDRLEKLMADLRQSKEEDPEMAQISGVMQDMLDLQYPERVAMRKEKAVPVVPDSVFRAIPAVIVDRARVASGGVVKLRLIDSAMVAGVMLPKGQLLFGLCQVSNQRLLLDIRTVRLGTSIVPVDLSVYSMDGIKGIAAPEAVLETEVGTGADNAIRRMDVLGLEQSIGMQAAGAGVMAAKSLLSRKVRAVKVKLAAGYRVLLRDNQRSRK